MKIFAFDLLNRLATDQKTVAERKWRESSLAPQSQQPCNIGLFSDDARQADLFTSHVAPKPDRA